jgi:Na+/H+ antiporter NhaD/arsenite permease-like protein
MRLLTGVVNLAVLIGFGILFRREVAENERVAAAGDAPATSPRRLLVFKGTFFVVIAAALVGLIWWSPDLESPGFVAVGILALVLLLLDQRRRGVSRSRP